MTDRTVVLFTGHPTYSCFRKQSFLKPHAIGKSNE